MPSYVANRPTASMPLSVPMPSDRRSLRVTDALALDPACPDALPDHARTAGALVRTLARLLRRETGMSYQQWGRHARLIEAMAALAQGDTVARAARWRATPACRRSGQRSAARPARRPGRCATGLPPPPPEV